MPSPASPFVPQRGPNYSRFSLNRVWADTGTMLRTNALSLLLVTVVAGIGLGVGLQALLTQLGMPGAVVWPSMGLAAQLAARGLRLAASAAMITAVLAVCLARRRHDGDRWAGLRAALVDQPAVLATLLISSYPIQAIGQLVLNVRWHATGELNPAFVGLTLFASGALHMAVSLFLGQAPQAVVAERLNPLAALARSIRLTRGRRLILLGLTLGWTTISVLIGMTFMQVALAAGEGAAKQLLALQPLWYAPLQMLQLVFFAAVYRELRRLIEPQVDAQAAVFD